MNMRMLMCLVLAMLTLNGCGWFKKEPTRPDNPVVMGISYVGITVKDIDAAQKLYTEVANLEVVAEEELRDSSVLRQLSSGHVASVKTVLLAGVNAQLRFMQFETPHGATTQTETSELANAYSPVPVNGPGIAHVCYQVNQTTGAYQGFLDAGSSFIGAKDMIQISSRNPVYYAYAHDPEGNVIEIEEVNVAELDLETPPEHDYRIRQVALSTIDMERSLDFYSVLFEEQHPRRMGTWIKLQGDKVDGITGFEESEIEMAWFQSRNLELEIVQYHSHPPQGDASKRPVNAPGYNMIMFEVASLEAVKQKLQLAGANIVLQDQQFDGLPVVFARDPDGNLLGFQPSDVNNPLSAAKFKNNGT